jgi:release factor glutamine methyltransferase
MNPSGTATMDEWKRRLGDRYPSGELAAMRRFWMEESSHDPDDVQWNRLVSGEPVQYVLRKAWFMGRTLEVDGSVLIPRPESEELVAWVLEEKENHAEAFLDLGTGSGCLALALSWKGGCRPVYGMDVSEEALKTARKNAIAWGLESSFVGLQADFMDKAWVPPSAALWISNPPYIGLDEAAQMEEHVLEYEPSRALFAPSQDPLDVYRALAEHFLKDPVARSFWLELNPRFAEECLLLWPGCQAQIRRDMQGKPRMLRVVKEPLPQRPADQSCA